MATQLELSEGKQHKEAGIELVTEHNSDFVEVMREFAANFSMQHGSISSDEVRSYALNRGLSPKHKNAWGAVFHGKHWKAIGCDECGKIIPLADFDKKRAVRRMVAPDSDRSVETWETLCRNHCPKSDMGNHISQRTVYEANNGED